MTSDDQEREILSSLWAAVFGEPPIIRCESWMLVQVLVQQLPPAPPYGFEPAVKGDPSVTGPFGRTTNRVGGPERREA